jgi:hypothetical protein
VYGLTLDASGSTSHSRTAIIIGCAIGGLVVVTLTFTLIFFYRRRQSMLRYARAEKFDIDSLSMEDAPHSPSTAPRPFPIDEPGQSPPAPLQRPQKASLTLPDISRASSSSSTGFTDPLTKINADTAEQRLIVLQNQVTGELEQLRAQRAFGEGSSNLHTSGEIPPPYDPVPG